MFYLNNYIFMELRLTVCLGYNVLKFIFIV